MVNYFKRRKEILNQLDVLTTRRANYRAQGGINYVDYSGGNTYSAGRQSSLFVIGWEC